MTIHNSATQIPVLSANFVMEHFNCFHDVETISSLLGQLTNLFCPEADIKVLGPISEEMVKELKCRLIPFNRNVTVEHISRKSATGDWFPVNQGSDTIHIDFHVIQNIGNGVD